jgi:hypothetical protein
MAPKQIEPQAIYRRWLHSHEEDTERETVYRPDTYDLPPARGREGFDLRRDQSCTDIGIGPTDKASTEPGTWELGADGQLRIWSGPGRQDLRTLRLISLDDERMVVER